jgi:hypothetical protein
MKHGNMETHGNMSLSETWKHETWSMKHGYGNET